MRKYTDIQVGFADVFRAFWRGIKPWKWQFLFCVISFTVANIIGLFVPLFYKKFFDLLTSGVAGAPAVEILTNIIVAVALFHAIQWVLYRTAYFMLNHVSAMVITRLKQISFDYLMGHSYTFFSNNFSGALSQRINRFGRAYEQLSDTLCFNIIPLCIHTIGAMTVVSFVNKPIAFIMLVYFVVFVTFNYFFSRWKLKYDTHMATADSKTSAVLADDITNQNTISIFSASKYESKLFAGVLNSWASIRRFTWNLEGVVDSVQAALVFLLEFVVFYYAIRFWDSGVITVGTFVLVQIYVIGMVHQLWGFGSIVRHLYQGFADSKEMVELLLLPHEVKDISHAKELLVTAGEIRLDKLSFSFNQTRTVIDDLSLTIKSGEKIALIGPSGAGKSTFVRLLLRMYEVAGGHILIDGQDIQKVTQDSLREAVSMVPQDPVLFHRTLMENIRYGKQDATDEEVFTAAQLAHCDEFIESLPLKYDTYVGERGIKLSGGERQRVAIARAILKNAPILILDEATSSLDSHSELLIQDALDKLMTGKTVIVIAHRLSTIRKMDRIVVLDGGKVTEEGTHDELLTKKGSLYKKLWELQAGGFLQEENTER